MRNVTLFCEDSFHEKFVGAMLNRLASDFGAAINVKFRSARGGLPRMQSELKDFLRDLKRDKGVHPIP